MNPFHFTTPPLKAKEGLEKEGWGSEVERVETSDIVARHGGLVRRTALVSALTLFSRILGYVREIVSAWIFGDRSGIYDAFVTAWRVPNLFRRFLGEGALATSFQTALTSVDDRAGLEGGRRLFLDTLWLLLKIVFALTVVVMALVAILPDRMPWTGWAWLGADPGPVRELTVRLMPYVVLACTTALFAGALNVRGHYAAPNWSPAVMNVVWLIALVLIAWRHGWTGNEAAEDLGAQHLSMTRDLAWGVLAAGLAQLLVHLPALRRHGFTGPARKSLVPFGKQETAGSVLQRATPLALGAAVYQVNVMVDGLMAEGLLADGGPTLHYYATRVQQFPMGLVAFAATSAVFPLLQALGSRRALGELRALHDRTHRAIVFVALPASVGLVVLARPIISVSFEHGAFGPEGVARATRALQWLSLAILPAGATGLVARTYYSLGEFRYPVRVSSALLAINVVLSLLCVLVLGMDVDGLALGTGLTSWIGLGVLLAGLRSRMGLPRGAQGMGGALARMALASVGSGAAAWGACALLTDRAGRVSGLLAGMAAGVAAYALLVALLGVSEVDEFKRRVANRLRRKN